VPVLPNGGATTTSLKSILTGRSARRSLPKAFALDRDTERALSVSAIGSPRERPVSPDEVLHQLASSRFTGKGDAFAVSVCYRSFLERFTALEERAALAKSAQVRRSTDKARVAAAKVMVQQQCAASVSGEL